MAFSPAIHETDLGQGVCISAPAGDSYQDAAGSLKAVLEETLSGAWTCCRTISWMQTAGT